MGKFIAQPFFSFEGGEGSGKTTCVAKLKELFSDEENINFPALFTREPGGTRIGKDIRAILLNSNNTDLHSKAELFLYLADRAQHVESMIRPALNEGKLVFSDRFADSTIVYQGVGRGLDMEVCRQLNDEATSGLWPCLTFYFDVDPTEGLRRANKRNTTDGISIEEGRFEAEALDFHTRLRDGYRQWFNKHTVRSFNINTNNKTPEQVFVIVVKAIVMAIVLMQKFEHTVDREMVSDGVARFINSCFHLTDTHEQAIEELKMLMSASSDEDLKELSYLLWVRYFYHPV